MMQSSTNETFQISSVLFTEVMESVHYNAALEVFAEHQKKNFVLNLVSNLFTIDERSIDFSLFTK